MMSHVFPPHPTPVLGRGLLLRVAVRAPHLIALLHQRGRTAHRGHPGVPLPARPLVDAHGIRLLPHGHPHGDAVAHRDPVHHLWSSVDDDRLHPMAVPQHDVGGGESRVKSTSQVAACFVLPGLTNSE